MTVLLRRLTKRSAEEKGSILILTAASTIVLMGVVGLGLDSGSLFYHRRVMQTAADAGAMHGASEVFRAQSALVASSARTGTAQNGFTDGAANVVVTVDHPPTTGFYVGDARFVEVRITQPSPTFFMRLFGFTTVQIPARAVAGAAAQREGLYLRAGRRRPGRVFLQQHRPPERRLRLGRQFTQPCSAA